MSEWSLGLSVGVGVGIYSFEGVGGRVFVID